MSIREDILAGLRAAADGTADPQGRAEKALAEYDALKRREVLAEAADRMADLLKDTPEYGPWVADQLRGMATDGGAR